MPLFFARAMNSPSLEYKVGSPVRDMAMCFGFSASFHFSGDTFVAKFAIFLDILKNSSSLGAGTVVYGEVMIILGALTIAYGTYNYLVAEKQIESDEYKPKRKVNVIFSILVIAIVVAMSFLLLKV